MRIANPHDDDRCELCGHVVVTYKRTMAKLWAVLLYRLNREHRDEWTHVGEEYYDLFKKRKDWQFLRHFGLMEMHPNDDPRKTYSGFWRMTTLGKLFVMGIEDVPLSVWVRENLVVDHSINRVFMRDALKRRGKFDVREILGIDPDTMEAA